MIMCGGVGSRFWPLSRAGMPKQFLDFFGTGRSLLQMTYDRILPIVDPERILIVTNRQYAPIVREQLPEIKEENILLEPARRNTAPCICWAASHIQAKDPDATIITLPSDHIVLKETAFHEAMRKGADFVETNEALLTLGIKPTYANTGYGYIQRGQAVDGYKDILKVKSFTEKPDEETAHFLFESGEFFWNAGIFIWKGKDVLEAFRKYAPETYELFEAGKQFYGTDRESIYIDEMFPSAQSISVDYAIMEKADNVYVETADLGWSDLGTWRALHTLSPKDRDGNVTQQCRVISHGCSGSIFTAGKGKIIVASGLDGYVVADNGNTLLIYPIKDEQKIRTVVNEVRSLYGEDYV